MLVLSRRIGERLVIDNRITVTVLESAAVRSAWASKRRRRFPFGARRS